MGNLFDAMIDCLEDKHLHYSKNEDRNCLVVCYHMEHTNVSCSITISEESRCLSFKSRAGVIAPSGKHEAAAEFITRANHGLRVGSFLFDYDNGDISFKTTLVAGNAEASPDVMHYLLKRSVSTFNYFYPGFVDVIYRDVCPAHAINNLDKVVEPKYTQEEIDKVVAKIFAGGEQNSEGALGLSHFEGIKARALQSPDGVVLPMKELVSALGQRRAGKHIVHRIGERLRAQGLGHEPASLPRNQNTPVRVFKMIYPG